MIHFLTEKVTTNQLQEMSQEYGAMVKIAVDVRRAILAGGGEMHADCERVLLENGSEQDDIWGANWYPAEQRVEFEALINIRPSLGNRSILIQSDEVRTKIDTITRNILGGTK